MAYWLFCQACKQWSKSATPLSEDKYCSYCNSSFITSKQRTYVNPYYEATVQTKESQHKDSQPEVLEVSKADESASTDRQKAVIKESTPKSAPPKLSETEENLTVTAAEQLQESSPNEIQEVTEPEIEDFPESVKTDEGSQESAISGSETGSEAKNEPYDLLDSQETVTEQPIEIQEPSAVLEASETDSSHISEIPKTIEPTEPSPAPHKARIVFTHAKPEDKTEKLDSQEVLEAVKTTDESKSPADLGASEDVEAPASNETVEGAETAKFQERSEEPELSSVLEVAEDLDLPATNDTIENLENSESQVIPDETESSSVLEIGEDQEFPLTIDSNQDAENPGSIEILEESESDTAGESSDSTDARNIPAHRIYIENRRRKKRRR